MGKFVSDDIVLQITISGGFRVFREENVAVSCCAAVRPAQAVSHDRYTKGSLDHLLGRCSEVRVVFTRGLNLHLNRVPSLSFFAVIIIPEAESLFGETVLV